MDMVRVTLTELDINAIGGALLERRLLLSHEIERLVTQPKSPSRDFAIDCNADALRDIVRVQLIIAAALEEDEPPEDATFADYFAGDHFAGMAQ
jgi:hypothetical protein